METFILGFVVFQFTKILKPMTNISASIQEIKQGKALQSTIRNAQERFCYKPFIVRYKTLHTTVKYGRLIFFSLFSIITGFSCLLELFNVSIGVFALSCGLSLLILVTVEFLKNESLKHFFEIYYSSKRIGVQWLLIVVAVGVCSLSVFLSLQGSKTFYQWVDQSATDIERTYQAKADSVSNFYNQQIDKANLIAQAYFTANSYKGKITYTRDGFIARHYQELSQTAEKWKEEKRQALQQLQKQKSNQLKSNTSKVAFNSHIFILLSLCNEVLILLTGWFLVYYDFQAIHEFELLEDTVLNHHQKFNTTQLNELTRMFNLLGIPHKSLNLPENGINTPTPSNNGNTSNNEKRTTIGFTQNTKGHVTCPEQNNTSKGINTPIKPNQQQRQQENTSYQQLQNYLKKYESVVKDIENGLSIKDIKQRNGISKSTIQNVKRCLKNLHSAIVQ